MDKITIIYAAIQQAEHNKSSCESALTESDRVKLVLEKS